MPNQNEIAKKLIDKMNRNAGRIKCEECSNKNWEVFHEPGKCPKAKKKN